MTKCSFDKVVPIGTLIAVLCGLAITNVEAANCATNTSPSSDCQSQLSVISNNTAITVPNTVTVSTSSGSAINNQATNTSLINYGTLHSDDAAGVYNGTGNSLALLNNSGTIFGEHEGVENNGGAVGSLTNSGTITAGRQLQSAVQNENSGSIGTLTNNGTIAGGFTGFAGIYNDSDSSITNFVNNGTIIAGTIIVGNNFGRASIVNDGNIGTLTNNGLITSSGSVFGGLLNGGNITSLVNYGTISGANSESSTSLYNSQESTIRTLTNFGTLSLGGSSIVNNGSISTLNNRQGAGNAAGALAIDGRLPTSYNIIIFSPTVYGQLNAHSDTSGMMRFGIYSGSIVAPGIYSSVLTGFSHTDAVVFGGTTSSLANTSGTYGLFDFALDQVGTTGVYNLQVSYDPAVIAAEQQSVQALANNQQTRLIAGRSTANELLGFTRPVEDGNKAYAGGLFGSALGYGAGQASKYGVTILGGIAYGSQDYGDAVKEDAAPTVAVAARYTFNDPFGDEENTLHPYAEIGGWVTPGSNINLTRDYSFGGNAYAGAGNSNSTDWDYYLRLGVTKDSNRADKLIGFGEIGEQALDFGGYSESAGSNNPTPATINAGQLSMGVLRTGGAWTHKLSNLPWDDDSETPVVPIAITLSGAVARSFDTHSGLTASSLGANFRTAETTDTWGEYGARIEGHVTHNALLGIDMLGTVGGGKLGNSTHAGVFLGYEF